MLTFVAVTVKTKTNRFEHKLTVYDTGTLHTAVHTNKGITQIPQ